MSKRTVSTEWTEWHKEPDTAGLERAGAIQDFAGAEAAYKQLIDQGSILSMVNLARWYELRPKGDGGPDFAQAELWYRKAIDAGSAVATLPVGYFYLRRKSYEKAREIFSIGMERGYAPSVVRLGDLYVKGLGVDKDYERAKDLFRQAAEAGNLWAKASLGAMTTSLASNVGIKCKGYLMVAIAGFQIRFQRWREPRSERLKK